MSGDDMERETDGVSRRDVLRTSAAGALTVAGTGLAASATAGGGTLVEKSHSWRTYYVYEPTWYDGEKDVPMLLMLHGCTQDGETFADETRMPEIAEEEGFIPVFPETTDHMMDCWHWFENQHTKRGNGEAAELAGIAEEVIDDYTIDEQKVYVAGFSAGAGMAPDLATEYADIFAGTGVFAGFVYDAADDENEANTVMSSGVDDPVEHGDWAYNSMEDDDITSMMPTFIVHGEEDYTVDTINGRQSQTQAVQTNDLAYNDADDGAVDDNPDTVETGSTGGYDWTRKEYEDPDGNVIVVKYIIDDLGHDWPGGATGGEYTAPDAPDGSQLMWDFLVQHERDNAGIGPGPNATIEVSDSTVAPGDTVTFDGSESSGGGSEIDSYDWAFDDGSTATGDVVEHSYDEDGSYHAELTITNEDGETDSHKVEIVVDSDPVAALAVSPDDPEVEEEVTFDGSESSGGGSDIDSYEWDFGDGTTATGETVTHTYDEADTYDVTLTVTNADGLSDSETVSVEVDTGLYCGTATNADHVDAGRAYNSWGCYYAEGSGDYLTCMDSHLSTLEETSDGHFEEVDECTDDEEEEDDEEEDDEDDGSDLDAVAAASPTDAELGEEITFDGSDSTDAESYEWDLDNGDAATGETVEYAYEEEGTYEVTLTITDGDEGEDTDTVTVDVDEDDLYCGVDTHENHVDAGRAYNSGGCYYAEGSDEYMGSCMAGDETQLEETSPGYFEVDTGNC